MKFRKNKIKYMLLAGGIISISAILPITLLTSCSSTSNPYGPYTVITNNGTGDIRYNTKTGNVEFFNNNNALNGEYENQWVDLYEIKSLYLKLSNENVKKVLADDTQLNTLLDKYKQTDRSADITPIDVEAIKKNYNNASFMYGVSTTPEQIQIQIQISNIYNYLSILSGIFNAVNSFATNMINYVLNSEFPQIYANISSTEKTSSIFGLAAKIEQNPVGKEFVIGKSSSLGSGDSTYQLWPSGFDLNISYIQNSKINQPYPYFNPGKDGTPFGGQVQVNATNITLNYQWYKTSKNGGSYVLASDVNSKLTKEQKQMLEKCGITEIKNNGFKVQISDLAFNVLPESYMYTDPIYSGIMDYVYTGLYNVVPHVEKINVSDKVDETITYPTYLEAESTKWRVIPPETKNNLYSEKSLGRKLYNDIQTSLKTLDTRFNNNDVIKLPYYSGNNQWSSNENDYVSYSILNNKLDSKDMKLDSKEMKYVSKLFVNPYYNEDGDRYVANNKNELPKANYLSLWVLGALSHDNMNSTDISNSYTDISNSYNELKSINSSEFSDPKNPILSKYEANFTAGLTTYYSLIKFGTISKGEAIFYNGNQVDRQ